MINAYQIGVALSLTSNHAQILQALGSGLLGVHTSIANIEKNWGRVHAAMAATGVLLTTGLIFKGMEYVTKKAEELSHQLVQVKNLGGEISGVMFERMRLTAQNVALTVPGVTTADALKIGGQAYSMLGAENALTIMPLLARLTQRLGNVAGYQGDTIEGIRPAIRAADLMGKLVKPGTETVDLNRLETFLNLISKVAGATHGTVTPQTWLQLAQQGGPALAGMSEEGLARMAIVSQGMGGFRGGTALMSLFQQFVGGKMTKQVAEKLHELGLVGNFKSESKGGSMIWEEGALNTPFARAIRTDPEAATEIMKQAMEAHGIHGIDDQTAELFKMLGRQTTQRLISDILRNMPQFLQETIRILGGKDLDAANQTANKEDTMAVLHNLSKAWDDLMAQVGNSQPLRDFLNYLADWIRSTTKAVEAMPEGKLEAIGKGIAILTASLGGAAVATLMAAIGPAGWIILTIGAFVGAALFFHDELEGFAKKLMAIRNSLADALRGIIDEFLKFLGFPEGLKTAPPGPGNRLFPNLPEGDPSGGIGGGAYHGGNLRSMISPVAWHGAQSDIGTIVNRDVDTGHLDPEFAARMKRFNAFLASEGIQTRVISGYRTYAEQANLRWRYEHGMGGKAARPGSSNHEIGAAIDEMPLSGSARDLDFMIRNAPRFGIYPGANFGDRDHFEMGHGPWHGPPKKPAHTTVHTSITLDGRKIGHGVSHAIAEAANYVHGPASFDGRAAVTPVDFSLQRGS